VIQSDETKVLIQLPGRKPVPPDQFFLSGGVFAFFLGAWLRLRGILCV